MDGAPPVPSAGSPFDRLRELALRIPQGAQELLPLVDFLETFPEQVTEEALVHLVGVTALGIAKAGQGGIWDGIRWAFLRGAAPPFPTNPGRGWLSLPWSYGDDHFGFLVLRATEAPPALPLLLSISAPLLAWRRLEALRSDQNRNLALQLSRLNTLFDLTKSFGEVESRKDLARLLGNTLMGEFRMPKILVVAQDGAILLNRGLGTLPDPIETEALQVLVRERHLTYALELEGSDRSHGFVFTAEPEGGRLGDEDEMFLQTLLNLASSQFTSLELREARLQTIRMEKDLDLARNIQRQILPKRLPEPDGWHCTAANLPYQAVGGDLYDLWLVQDPERGARLHFAVADISGKGLPASLMMTQLSAFLRATADRRVMDWAHLAQRLNARMNTVRDRNRYATLVMGSLNPEDGTMRYVNAGHNPPLLVRPDGEVHRLEPTGPMVGLLPGATFSEGRVRMEPGDVLVLFTDGVVEAEDTGGQELGDAPLIEAILRNPTATGDDLFERLLVRVLQHMEGGGFKDDVTLMVIKRLEAAGGTLS